MSDCAIDLLPGLQDLDRGSRTLQRKLFCTGNKAIWYWWVMLVMKTYLSKSICRIMHQRTVIVRSSVYQILFKICGIYLFSLIKIAWLSFLDILLINFHIIVSIVPRLFMPKAWNEWTTKGLIITKNIWITQIQIKETHYLKHASIHVEYLLCFFGKSVSNIHFVCLQTFSSQYS